MFEVEVKVTFNFQLLTELDQTKLNWAVTQLKSNLEAENELKMKLKLKMQLKLKMRLKLKMKL